jgi:lipopolysaccharide transport system ATP-binding protein
MAPVIQIDKLSKRYLIGTRRQRRYRMVRESLSDAVTASLRWLRRSRSSAGRKKGSGEGSPDLFWALKDVSFEVEQGDIVGIIGRNGAGKSTLLKILSRITEPTEGRAMLRGRLGSLLEVGTGFHQELTGRENIYLNGAILGMRKREIDRQFDAIVDFSEVGPFLDTPVKNYSSGMYVRLAFAVAAHLEPEILIIDEVLAVGDMEFQKKCLGKMGQVAQSGRTVLLVSHNLAMVQNLCRRAVLLSHGRMQQYGECADVLATYLESSEENSSPLAAHRPAGKTPIMQDVQIRNAQGDVTDRVFAGDRLSIHIRYESPTPLDRPIFGITFQALTGEPLFYLQSLSQHGPMESLPAEGWVACVVPELPLVPGGYVLSFYCSSMHVQGELDSLERAVMIHVEGSDYFGTGRLPPARTGNFLVRAAWEFTQDR